MPTPSDNHGFDLNYQQGEDGWDYNDEFESLESKVEVRDTNDSRSTYTAHENAKFIATDTGDVYLGDGAAWNHVGSIGDLSAFLADGDGVDREIWVIPNGASDPAGAGPDDLIFEEEA